MKIYATVFDEAIFPFEREIEMRAVVDITERPSYVLKTEEEIQIQENNIL